VLSRALMKCICLSLPFANCKVNAASPSPTLI
jgi:hypothetical protein